MIKRYNTACHGAGTEPAGLVFSFRAYLFSVLIFASTLLFLPNIMVLFNNQPRYIRSLTRLLLCGAAGGVLLNTADISGRAQTPPAAPNPPRAVAPATPPVAPASPSSSPASAPSLADMRIETFGPERGYVVGVESVVLLCVVRNAGAMPLPADALRLRCYPISGLDYTSGNLLPILPLLAPGQAVAYRWRLAQSDAKMVLAAGVVLERTEEGKRGEDGKASAGTQSGGTTALPDNSAPTSTPVSGGTVAAGNAPSPLLLFSSKPLLAFSIIPRLPRAPGFGDAPVSKDALPHADERDGVALVLNNRVGMRVQIGTGRDSLLQLAAREGAGWRIAAFAMPLLRANVAEDGQIPWWQTFRCQSIRAREDKDSAALTLTGTLGAACRVEIVFEARPDTCVLSGRARLTATRPLRLSGIHLPALIAGGDDRNLSPPRQDGSPLLLADTPSPLPDDARVAAAHIGAATFGLSWPADPPLSGWKWTRLPGGDGAYTLNLGAQALGSLDGDLVPAGTTIEIPFRLFAFAPSDTVRDALRFQLP